MSIITLTSDYGTLDYRTSAIKGKILSLEHHVQIVDITHHIEAHNLIQTAHTLERAYVFFPKETVHIISVDSFHHKDRKYLVTKVDGHYFILTDNGILSLMFHHKKPDYIFEITLNNRFDDVVRFPTTDIFVPVAIHLIRGGLPELIGRKTTAVREISFPKAVYHSGEKLIVGEVLYIDNFGNAITNIKKEDFNNIASKHQSFELKFRNISLKNIYHSYTEIVPSWEEESHFHGKAMALFNDHSSLELSIYKGCLKSGASSLLGLNVREKIFVQFT